MSNKILLLATFFLFPVIGAVISVVSTQEFGTLTTTLVGVISIIVLMKHAMRSCSFAGPVMSLVFVVGLIRYMVLPAHLRAPLMSAIEGFMFGAIVLLGAVLGHHCGKLLIGRGAGGVRSETAAEGAIALALLSVTFALIWFGMKLSLGAYNTGEGSALEGMLRIIAIVTLGACLTMRSRLASRAAIASIIVLAAGTLLTGFVGGALAVALVGCFWAAFLLPRHGVVVRPLLAPGLLVTALVVLATTDVVNAGRNLAFGEGRKFSPSDISLDITEIDAASIARRLELATPYRLAVDRQPPSLVSQDIGDLLIVPILVAFTPDMLWSERPNLNQGRVLSAELYGLPANTISSSTAGWLAEAKLASGYVGVGAISAFVAICLTVMAGVLGRVWRPATGGVWVIASFYLIDFESPIVPWMAGLLRSLAIVAMLSVLVALVHRRRTAQLHTRGVCCKPQQDGAQWVSLASGRR